MIGASASASATASRPLDTARREQLSASRCPCPPSQSLRGANSQSCETAGICVAVGAAPVLRSRSARAIRPLRQRKEKDSAARSQHVYPLLAQAAGAHRSTRSAAVREQESCGRRCERGIARSETSKREQEGGRQTSISQKFFYARRQVCLKAEGTWVTLRNL